MARQIFFFWPAPKKVFPSLVYSVVYINENTVNIQLIVDRCVLDATSCRGANCTIPIKNSKFNITRIIGTALSHVNLKCPQNAIKLNINEQYDGA